MIEPTYLNLPHKSRTLHNLGWLAWHEGRLDEAEQYLTRALEIRQGYGNEYGVARTLELLARLRFSHTATPRRAPCSSKPATSACDWTRNPTPP